MSKRKSAPVSPRPTPYPGARTSRDLSKLADEARREREKVTKQDEVKA